jgi:hypothetical protein
MRARRETSMRGSKHGIRHIYSLSKPDAPAPLTLYLPGLIIFSRAGRMRPPERSSAGKLDLQIELVFPVPRTRREKESMSAEANRSLVRRFYEETLRCADAQRLRCWIKSVRATSCCFWYRLL